MKESDFYLLAGFIFTAPHTSELMSLLLGLFAFIVAIVIYMRGDQNE